MGAAPSRPHLPHVGEAPHQMRPRRDQRPLRVAEGRGARWPGGDTSNRPIYTKAQPKPSCTQEGGVSSDAGLSALETRVLPRYQGRAARPSAASGPGDHPQAAENHTGRERLSSRPLTRLPSKEWACKAPH